MKFILTGLGNWYPAWNHIVNMVREAEQQGYWAVLFPDQYMWDPSDLGAPSTEGIDNTLETWTMLAYLSAKTRNIRLGTWVTPIPFRHPAQLAKTVSSLDAITQGRVILGIGAGVTQRMFEAYSEWDSPGTRVDKTREGVELIMRLWSEPKVNHQGKHYNVKETILEPKPVQKPHPPLLFGGAGKRMLKLAGRHADICYIPPWNNMKPEDAKKIVLDQARRSGRDDKIEFAYAYTPLGPKQFYDREQYRKNVEDAKDQDYDYFITAFNMDAAPWDLDPISAPRVSESYRKSLVDFAKTFMQSKPIRLK